MSRNESAALVSEFICFAFRFGSSHSEEEPIFPAPIMVVVSSCARAIPKWTENSTGDDAIQKSSL